MRGMDSCATSFLLRRSACSVGLWNDVTRPGFLRGNGHRTVGTTGTRPIEVDRVCDLFGDND